MMRLLGLGVLFAASSVAAQAPADNAFAIREVVATSRPAPELRFDFESPRVDYSRPARPERKQGFLAAVRVASNGFLGIGMSNRKARRSAMGPDPVNDGRRGSKKLALRYVLNF